jgi:hypothetical protein
MNEFSVASSFHCPLHDNIAFAIVNILDYNIAKLSVIGPGAFVNWWVHGRMRDVYRSKLASRLSGLTYPSVERCNGRPTKASGCG